MKIYIVVVVWEAINETKVSQEGYYNYEDAVNFIKSRHANIDKINDWCYYNDEFIITYNIKEITVK